MKSGFWMGDWLLGLAVVVAFTGADSAALTRLLAGMQSEFNTDVRMDIAV